MEPEKDIFYKLVEKAKTTTLTDRERSKLFMTVDAYVERNPIKIKASQVAGSGAQSSTQIKEAQPSPFMGVVNGAKSGLKSAQRTFRSAVPESFLPIKSPLSINFSNLFAFNTYHSYGLRTAAVLLVVVLFGSGTSFAAQSSLPGDFLYPIKVSINEEVKSIFLSGIDESQYEVVRAEKRIEEVKKLIAQNKLSPEVQKEITSKLSSHVAKVEKDVDELTKKGELKSAFEISSHLENSLVESEIAIAKIAKADVAVPGSAVQIAVAEDIIRGPQENSATVRETTEDQIYTRQNNDADTETIAIAKLDSVKKTLALINEKSTIKIDAIDSAEPVTATAMAKVAPATLKVDSVAKKADPAAASGSSVATDETASAESATETQPTTADLVVQVNELLAAGEEQLANQEFNEAFRLFREADRIAGTIRAEIEAENAENTEKILDPEASVGESLVTNTSTDTAVTDDLTAKPVNNTANVSAAAENMKTKPVEKKPQ